MKKCPACAEQIHDDVQKCGFCGETLVSARWLDFCLRFAELAPQDQEVERAKLSDIERESFDIAWELLGPRLSLAAGPAALAGTERRSVASVREGAQSRESEAPESGAVLVGALDKPYRCPKCREPVEPNGSKCVRCGLVFDVYVPPSKRATPTEETGEIRASAKAGPPTLPEKFSGVATSARRNVVLIGIGVVALLLVVAIVRTKTPMAEEAVPPSVTGDWKVSETTDPISDRTTASASLAALGHNLGTVAVLELSCPPDGRLRLQLALSAVPLQSRYSVVMRFDEEDPVETVDDWIADGRRVLLYEPSKVRLLALRLRDHDRLTVRVETWRGSRPQGRPLSSATATFDLLGVRQAVRPVADACGWRRWL